VIVKLAERDLKTKFGVFHEHLYYDGQKESIAITMGDLEHAEEVPCRVHSACIAAHVFNSIECDCREQMEIAQAIIQQEGSGVIIWLDQEGRGHGHLAVMNVAKVAAEQGIPQTQAYKKLGYAADGRDFTAAAQILADLRVKSVTLITNNPNKVEAVKQAGIPVSGTRQAAISTEGNESLKAYYADKKAKGHNL
jgi:3,4-dihydroxy 2-butanone 4-phosphate synthase/GTP cyclohydrolase II